MTVYKSEKSTNSLLPPTGNSCVHALPSKPQAISLTPAFDSDKKNGKSAGMREFHCRTFSTAAGIGPLVLSVFYPM